MANNTIDTLVIDVSARAAGAAQGIDLLAASLERLKEAIRGNTGANLLKLATNIERLKASLGGLNVSGAQLDGLSTGLSAVSAATGDAKNGVQAVNDATKETGASTKAAASGLDRVGESARRAGDSARSASRGGFSQLLRDVVRIAKYRAIRTALKAVTSGIREGMQNLYQYSAAMRSTDSANFKNTMDGYATSFLYLKNSVGAAVAPLVQAFLPVIKQIVSWIVAAANAVNQFISALQGKSTYTRATEAATQYATATGKAGKAAKKLQNILMGFDEINLIETPKDSGGGGGGASTPNYSKMFEEAPIQFGEFERILDIVKTIGESLVGIWNSPLVKFIRSAAIEVVLFTLESIASVLQIISELLNGTITADSLFDALERPTLWGWNPIKDLEDWFDNKVGKGELRKHVQEYIDDFWGTLSKDMRAWGEMLSTDVAYVLDIVFNTIDAFTYSTPYENGIREMFANFTSVLIDEIEKISGVLDAMSYVFDFIAPGASVAWKGLKTALQSYRAELNNSEKATSKYWTTIESRTRLFGTRMQNSIGTIVAVYDPIMVKTSGFAKRFGNELDVMRRSALSKSPKIGEAVVNGITYALNAGQQATYNSMLLLGYTQEEAIKKALEINSPSKVMQRIGGYVVLGLTSGITDGVNNVKTAINGLSTAASDTMKGNATSSIWSVYGKNMMVDIEKGIKGNVGLIVGATKKVAEAASQGLGTYSGYVRWQKEGKYILMQMQSSFIQYGSIVSNAFAKNVANPIADIMNLLIKRIIGRWNSMLQEFKNSGARLNSNGSISITTAKSYNVGGIQKFASGGFAGPGQLFISRESGPELVASASGGGTNVMNNDQIVKSVSDGVYRAMMDTGFVGYLSDIASNTEGGNKPVFAPSAEAGRWISRSSKMYAAQGGR